MTQNMMIETPDGAAVEARQADRRRPGRSEVSPELIPLLRARTAPESVTDTRDWSVLDDEDGMAPARGVVLGLLLAVPLWGVIGVVGFFVF